MPWRILTAAVLCYAALGVVLAILPRYVGDTLDGGSFAVGLAIGAPAATGALARPLGGRLADRRGPAPVLAAGALTMAVGVLPAALPTVPAQVASRLLVGLGEGAMMAATVLWMLRVSPPDRQARALGWIGLANYAGLTVGPLLATAIAANRHHALVLLLAAALPLLALAAAPRHGPRPAPAAADGGRARELLAATAGPGVGLLLVNVGYVAVLSFAALALHQRAIAGATLVVPLFAATVVVVRLAGGAMPDRIGAGRTLTAAAPAQAAGLTGLALAPGPALALPATVLLAAGQALAVPALGRLALGRVPAAHHGAAAGLFFAWFDAGVGLGGPAAGLLAGLGGPTAALLGAAAAVTLVPLVVRAGGPA
ncbi:MFS transporter [Patulibacter defluvii]|uniref:MFS transporter n=1 Tax=Patulibacter defluvii TaxID=3095358 RepID=UPI002A7576A3|nr:MFS transporter [Patulibacter sp. DM4]